MDDSFFYRIDRLINWQSRSGIQLNNSLIVIGSTGFLGHNSIPLYYPELETDFIFTSFTSVFGIVGGLFLIILVFSFDLFDYLSHASSGFFFLDYNFKG